MDGRKLVHTFEQVELLRVLLLSEKGPPYLCEERFHEPLNSIGYLNFEPMFKVYDQTLVVKYMHEMDGNLTLTDVWNVKVLGYWENGYVVQVLKRYKGSGEYEFCLLHKNYLEETTFKAEIAEQVKRIIEEHKE